MKNLFAFFLSFALLLSAVLALNTRMGMVPPMGAFLSPSQGFWQNEGPLDLGLEKNLKIRGLKGTVTIHFDDRRIPHVFAEEEEDLYFAQGYLLARQRLWQMETQIRAISGRLAEIVGPKALKRDRFMRRLGILETCRKIERDLVNNPRAQKVVQAYSAGINSYIKKLRPHNYPVEYKILDYRPEYWSPLKSILLLKLMAWRLTGRYFWHEIEMTKLRKKLGEKKMNELFPLVKREEDPVIPRGLPEDLQPLSLKSPASDFLPDNLEFHLPDQAPPGGQGSNNWAAAGAKTKSGAPLLAADPHLRLTLPSIWYEMQLSAPGVNVYGVTIPGAPGILIGFNENIAWGLTNSEVDVTDHYYVRFQDKSREKYYHDGKWKETRQVVETIEVRGAPEETITVTYTHHGPVVLLDKRSGGTRGLAFRWIGHEVSNELRTFYELNRASGYKDYTEALRHHTCPGQNFVFASRQGHIAIWHNGRFPARWKGQGRYISSGESSAHEWQAFIPHEQKPHIKNPARGFVASANQYPVERSYPYFFDGKFEQWRNKRINELLRENHNITPKDFMDYQLDTKNVFAQRLLPLLLKVLPEEKLDRSEKKVYQILQKWNYHQKAHQTAPTVFDVWKKKLRRELWKDEIEEGPYPSEERMLRVFLKNEKKWFDRQLTERKEGAGDLAFSTFRQTCQKLYKERGEPGERWHWGNYKSLTIRHVGRLKGFGKKLKIGGGWHVLQATTKKTGPSWRMVVHLGEKVEAWGVYPGGQSGNPGSPHYNDFLDNWATGKYYRLIFMKKVDEPQKLIQSTWTLGGAK